MLLIWTSLVRHHLHQHRRRVTLLLSTIIIYRGLPFSHLHNACKYIHNNSLIYFYIPSYTSIWWKYEDATLFRWRYYFDIWAIVRSRGILRFKEGFFEMFRRRRSYFFPPLQTTITGRRTFANVVARRQDLWIWIYVCRSLQDTCILVQRNILFYLSHTHTHSQTKATPNRYR